jgi:hypothetical protein
MWIIFINQTTAIGPFPTREAAEAHGRTLVINDWHLIELTPTR